jgi:hypothetical protein
MSQRYTHFLQKMDLSAMAPSTNVTCLLKSPQFRPHRQDDQIGQSINPSTNISLGKSANQGINRAADQRINQSVLHMRSHVMRWDCLPRVENPEAFGEEHTDTLSVCRGVEVYRSRVKLFWVDFERNGFKAWVLPENTHFETKRGNDSIPPLPSGLRTVQRRMTSALEWANQGSAPVADELLKSLKRWNGAHHSMKSESLSISLEAW